MRLKGQLQHRIGRVEISHDLLTSLPIQAWRVIFSRLYPVSIEAEVRQTNLDGDGEAHFDTILYYTAYSPEFDIHKYASSIPNYELIITEIHGKYYTEFEKIGG